MIGAVREPGDTTLVGSDDGGRSLRTLALSGVRLREALYQPAQEIPARVRDWANLCLALEGGYEEAWGRTRIRCGPASLLFHPPGQVYGDRISDRGSRCFTVAIEPTVFRAAADAVPELARLDACRRAAPSWLVFHLRSELQVRDDLSPASVESTLLELLAEMAGRPGFRGGRTPPPWLERVRERIHDEFARNHTLEELAQTAGVNRAYLARVFRRHYGCTVGEYARQLRVELACHRLLQTGDRLSGIAFDAGFADQSHLTNTFRRFVGLTPGAFRLRFSNGHRSGIPVRPRRS